MFFQEREYNFHEFFVHEFDAQAYNQKLLNKMNVLNAHKTIPEKEWEVASLYLTFAFRKRKDTNHVQHTREVQQGRFIRDEDVKVLV